MAEHKELPKNYSFETVEARIRNAWKDNSHYFIKNSDKPRFIIDTPPPYPTGEFHIGNALNWCYIDFFARYKRMKGFNVMFPQGWDCHGLPTEVKVEELNDITKNDVPREKFREMCKELTLKNINKMRETLRKMAFSTDWSNEYITMLPEYYSKTQISFTRMLKAGYIYRSEHPVNYCTRCETAIAFAEVSYSGRDTKLNYFLFDKVEIATTRPELLVACVAVAVHPEDERYTHLQGSTLTVPLFGHKVPVVYDDAVDPSFGSGAVMICTFGDKTDVFWWKKHNLELRKAIDRSGRMTDIAGKYSGLRTEECRQAVINDLKEQGYLKKVESLSQRVGLCWRCKTPIEIMSEHQWFVKIERDQILDAARKVKWFPEHMFLRMENWVSQMEWDWCISRQRIFATPIPIWTCANCHAMIIPEEDELPIDPTISQPKIPCPECDSNEFIGEKDVLDTWMDSSISVLYVTGWDGKAEKPTYFPAQIRPQGHDIIRTWAFYTILRSLALTNEAPWEEILINGMVLGEDGFKMSKSRGNIIVPEEILSKYGADALRQWAATGASTGSDIMFSWNDVISAHRFQTKMWNITRFSLLQLERKPYDKNVKITAPGDRWLLSKLSETIKLVTQFMDEYRFDDALRTIREFAWTNLADNYIELVKGRLYTDGNGRDGACKVLETTIDTIFRLLAPFTPYFAEECYSYLNRGSVHDQDWPQEFYNLPDSAREGDILVSLVASIRKFKNEHGMALNAPLGSVTIYSDMEISESDDAALALNTKVLWKRGQPELERKIKDVIFNKSVIGPALRNRAQSFMQAVRELSVEQLINPPEKIDLDGEKITIPEGSFSPEFMFTSLGEEVDVITLPDFIAIVRRCS